jgi:hypothetical protein
VKNKGLYAQLEQKHGYNLEYSSGSNLNKILNQLNMYFDPLRRETKQRLTECMVSRGLLMKQNNPYYTLQTGTAGKEALQQALDEKFRTRI